MILLYKLLYHACSITTLSATAECEIRGQIWTECGTACPLVCGEERPQFCTLQCVSECQCPPETLLDRASSSCVTTCPTIPIPEVDPTSEESGTTLFTTYRV